jgi:long-chain fatty acid transport protein
MKVHRLSRFLTGIALALPGGGALSGQGFGLNEIGACALARGFANTGAPCKDASTIFWNPAATTALSGWAISVGAASIALEGKFRQDTTGREFDSNAPTAFVPSAFVNYHKASSKASYGLGFYVPYGLTSQWTDDFPGRFQAQKASLHTIYLQPNFAWQINKDWSVGGGPIVGFSSVELKQSQDLSGVTATTGITFGQLGIPRNTEFARVQLKGDAVGYGAQIGVMGHLNSEWTVGARYLTSIKFNYDDADATFTQVPTNLVLGGTLLPPFFVAGAQIDALVAPQFATGGKLHAQSASTKITHPAQFGLGFGYTGFKNVSLDADYAWTGWKKFDMLDLTFPGDTTLNKHLLEQYNNTSAIRIGAEYTIPNKQWQVRAGFAGVASAAPAETVTPLLPEQDRGYYTLGVGIPFGRYAIDGSYAYIRTPGARGRIVERNTTAQTAAQLNTGVYSLNANIFAVSLKASF